MDGFPTFLLLNLLLFLKFFALCLFFLCSLLFCISISPTRARRAHAGGVDNLPAPYCCDLPTAKKRK